MPTTFRPYAPDQDLLLAPSLHDWLPSDHLPSFLSEIVDELYIHAFYSLYVVDCFRKHPSDPRMILYELYLSQATGSFSSLQLATTQEEDVSYGGLVAVDVPPLRTICA